MSDMAQTDASVQDQTAAPATPTPSVDVQAPAPATQGTTGPWADALASFEDEGVRARVDEFLRTNVQPHVTRIEQERASLKPAESLYNDFSADPASTLLSVTEELYGPEGAEALRAALFANDDTSDDDASTDYEPDSQRLDPRVEKWVNAQEEAENQRIYNAALDVAIGGDNTIVRELLHPFVSATNGDIPAAIAAYKQYGPKVAEAFGGVTTPSPDDVPAPPAVLGSDTPATTAPPVQKVYTSIDEALDDTLAEMRSRAAPPVVGAS